MYTSNQQHGHGGDAGSVGEDSSKTMASEQKTHLHEGNMGNEWGGYDADYNPVSCDHRIPNLLQCSNGPPIHVILRTKKTGLGTSSGGTSSRVGCNHAAFQLYHHNKDRRRNCDSIAT